MGFYQALAQRLNPGAVGSVQSTSPRRATELFLCIGRTIETAGYHALLFREHLPSFGDWGSHLAWRGGSSPEQMRGRLGRPPPLAVETRHATPAVIDAAFVFGRHELDSPHSIRANTHMRPVILDYYRRSRY